jgi:anti-sigma factor RsiW
MTRWRRTTACERAAQWISLELDGELGRLEQAAVAGHLRRCQRCRDWSAATAAFTTLIRDAPALGPERAPVAVTPPWVRKRRRNAWRGGAIATCLLAAVAGAMIRFPSSRMDHPNGLFVFATPKQQRLYVRAHILNEPALYMPDPLRPAESYALRPLL